MTTNAIITKTYNETTVLTFRNDGWFNMTKAAKAFGKELKHFWTRPDTVALLDELKKESADSADYYETARGYNGGTWAHPELAIEFARWLDVKFARWCNAVIKDILTGAAQVNIVKPEQSEILKMPTSMLEAGKLWLAELERAEALKLENAKQAEVIAEQAPKAGYYDKLVVRNNSYNPTEIAKLLNLLLNAIGWQYRSPVKGIWTATRDAVLKGYVETKQAPKLGNYGGVVNYVSIMQSGLEALIKMLEQRTADEILADYRARMERIKGKKAA